MKVAYLMTFAFLGLLMLSFLMYTIIKALRNTNFEEIVDTRTTAMPVEKPASPKDTQRP